MRLSISGTYSAGKTFTTMALAHYTGIPRSPARTIREIMPDAVPGKALTEVTPAEYIQLAVRRHVGRAVSEALLGDNFVADGSSLQEWTYAAARVEFGMDPGRTPVCRPLPRPRCSSSARSPTSSATPSASTSRRASTASSICATSSHSAPTATGR